VPDSQRFPEQGHGEGVGPTPVAPHLRGSAGDQRAPARERPRTSASWPPWMAPVALVLGLVLALVGSLVVDIPALILGAKISESHVPHGLVIADTAVQDVGFVIAALFVAQLGGRRLDARQFGLRPVPAKRAIVALVLAGLAFLVFVAAWASAVHVQKEKLLETLGTKESAALLIASAALTCVLAPVCEEFLFRGFIFGALRNWRGVWPAAILTGLLFGAVHAGSAPAADLVPLAVLGFLLCLIYQYTGSLYPCIALHALNNSIAFASLEEWSVGEGALLLLASFVLIATIGLTLMRAGVIPRSSLQASRPGSV
jgi:membrane protease YdiL (CAAX protease family)